jgi:mRNA interferase MazF
VRRGEVRTIAGGPDYAGQARPAVIVQSDLFDATRSVTLCAFTTDPTEAPLVRLPVKPTDKNGLANASTLMVDKLSTVQRAKLGRRLGRLDPAEMVRLERAVLVFLGLAGEPPG